jgi:hypothetical protein
MEKPCDICLDPKCDGKQDCNCSTCEKKDMCYRKLSPTIRITTKCTQSCHHCCFSCSPKENKMMTIETSKIVGKFLKSNKVRTANLMGGEFFCNPDWFEIFSNILNGLSIGARIVTNSDWVASKSISDKVVEVGKNFNIYYALSLDKFHTNKYVEEAKRLLKENNILYELGNHESEGDGIVPVGNGMYFYGFYSTFHCYCKKPDNMYSFLIDEEGIIYKCCYGIWDYSNVNKYQNGGFNKKFKEANLKFYSNFVPNCKTCVRVYNMNR